MTDRVPGAPGQYTMIVAASEAQKILTGEAVTVTLTRDDQPLVEGTPYNKQSVLPDDLAAKICPEVVDPAPADAFQGLTVKQRDVILAATGWSSAAPYTQSVAVAGLTDNRRAMAYPDVPEDAAQEEAFMEQAGKITSCRRSGSVMTFRCREEKPEIDIPVIVEVYV